MSNRDRMKKAIEDKPPGGPDGKLPKPPKSPRPLAAAATPGSGGFAPKLQSPLPKPKNPRSAKARDARQKARGRLPVGTTVEVAWDGKRWGGWLTVKWDNGNVAHRILHDADGVFRLLEELDVKFWEFAAAFPEKSKTLPWPAEDVKPDPYPKEKK